MKAITNHWNFPYKLLQIMRCGGGGGVAELLLLLWLLLMMGGCGCFVLQTQGGGQGGGRGEGRGGGTSGGNTLNPRCLDSGLSILKQKDVKRIKATFDLKAVSDFTLFYSPL